MNPVHSIRRRAVDLIPANPFRLRSDVGIVSFTFDDFARSSLLEGGRILNAHGLAGTYYVSGGLTDREENARLCHSEQDLLAASKDGHEIGSHGMGHVAAPTLSRDAYETDLQANADFVTRVLGEAVVQSYSYPFGERTLRDKRIVARRFKTGRSIRLGINRGLCDLADLRANAIYAGNFDEREVRRLIAMAARSRGWLVFYTHDISKDPTPWGCLPRMFEIAVRHAVESGCRVMPVREAFEVLTFRGNNSGIAKARA